MKAQFQRILDLVKRTGDRMVVTDPDGEHAYVVMDLGQYELLLAQNKASLVDFSVDEEVMGDFDEESEDVNKEEKIPEEIRRAVEHDLAIIQSWEQDHEKKGAEQSQQSQKKDAGGTDEERFYLEPIE